MQDLEKEEDFYNLENCRDSIITIAKYFMDYKRKS
jgi:hypothetical protein